MKQTALHATATPAAQDAEECPTWSAGSALQIDSYATGHPQCYSRLDEQKRVVSIALTDGDTQWTVAVPLPKDWRK